MGGSGKMATYSYTCDKCKKEIDYTLGMNEDRPEIHEECGGELKRIYSVRVNADQGKSDPSSPMYWKKGLSDARVADILNENHNGNVY